MKGGRLSHDAKACLLSLGAGLPAVATAVILGFQAELSPKAAWTLAALIGGSWIGLSLLIRAEVARPLRTISNLLAALREGDFSIRGRLPSGSDALGVAVSEINALGQTLREQRLGALEAAALLSKVMAEVDVAVFAFDAGGALRLANRAGERLLGERASSIIGAKAEALGMDALLAGPVPRTIEAAFPGGTGPWELRRGSFRQEGLPHELIVLCDLERALREEERQAWQRLVRVLGHEINNSLAPIRSLAENLQTVLKRRPDEWDDDMEKGLAVIARRSDGLTRFMTSYARLARLPPPVLHPLEVGAWIRRGVELEKRLVVEVAFGPELTIEADGDQLDQVLINLLKNAVEAASETGGGVRVEWSVVGSFVEVRVTDEGPGLPESGNLFVPFFTTKPGGSGIGLVLSRQIAEAHGGKLVLQDKVEGRGCVARLILPLPLERRGAHRTSRSPLNSTDA